MSSALSDYLAEQSARNMQVIAQRRAERAPEPLVPASSRYQVTRFAANCYLPDNAWTVVY